MSTHKSGHYFSASILLQQSKHEKHLKHICCLHADRLLVIQQFCILLSGHASSNNTFAWICQSTWLDMHNNKNAAWWTETKETVHLEPSPFPCKILSTTWNLSSWPWPQEYHFIPKWAAWTKYLNIHPISSKCVPACVYVNTQILKILVLKRIPLLRRVSAQKSF